MHVFFLMIPPPPRSTLFPYTTLFRSATVVATVKRRHRTQPDPTSQMPRPASAASQPARENVTSSPPASTIPASNCRSEEHTSELQSRRDLVCRLLLEKKKISRLTMHA